jgi:hypothetical protein
VVLGIHLIANSSSRFRVPWMPLLIVYSSFAMCRWRWLLANAPRSYLVLASLALTALLGWACVFFLPDAIHLWHHATYADPGRP